MCADVTASKVNVLICECYYVKVKEEQYFHCFNILLRSSATLSDSVKYNSAVRSPKQVIYEFRTGEASNLLRIEDSDTNSREAVPLSRIEDFMKARTHRR